DDWCARVFVLEYAHAPADFRKQVAGCKLEIVVVDTGHRKVLGKKGKGKEMVDVLQDPRKAWRSSGTPSFMTTRIFESSATLVVGSPSTSRRSARLPAATTPNDGSSVFSRKRAGSSVAARMTSAGVMPPSTRSASSRCSPAPGNTPVCAS